MERPELLLRYLSSHAYERTQGCPEPGLRPFLTISRQAGAGGHTLAELIPKAFEETGAEKLKGWQWADRAICESLAADPKMGVSLDSLLDERFRGHLEDYLSQTIVGTAPQMRVHRALFRTIRSLAAFGRVVILGRGGVCCTRGFKGGVHVRLIGSRPVRVQRTMSRLSCGKVEAERWVDAQDKERAGLLKEYFGARIDDPMLYDVVLNTDRWSPKETAAAIADLVLARARDAVAA
ncbi:MAG: cytidylate kinase-like family protein [Elusimicrobia bacterium]|nr:cytidylate kinase-like family protein [Elusimicrobiota bacterium]